VLLLLPVIPYRSLKAIGTERKRERERERDTHTHTHTHTHTDAALLERLEPLAALEVNGTDTGVSVCGKCVVITCSNNMVYVIHVYACTYVCMCIYVCGKNV